MELSPPCGEFTLELPADEHKPLVFIAGGVGITPLMSMLHARLDKSSATRPVVFIQGALNSADQAFADELHALRAKYPNLHTNVRQTRTLSPSLSFSG